MTLASGLKHQTAISAEKGRVTLLEYQDKGAPKLHNFANSQQLLHYFDGEEEASSKLQPLEIPSKRQRLFILEDLSRNHVEVLGSRLKIHPILFARHWGDLSFLESVDDFSTMDHPISHLTLPFSTFLNAPTILGEHRTDLEELYLANFNVRRILALPKPFGPWDLRSSVTEMESCFSYWSKPNEHGGSDSR